MTSPSHFHSNKYFIKFDCKSHRFTVFSLYLYMKKLLVLFVALLGAVSVSQAGGIHFSIGIPLPLPIFSAPAPAYVAPPPAYGYPGPYYGSAPCYGPAPYYGYPSPYYGYSPYVTGPVIGFGIGSSCYGHPYYGHGHPYYYGRSYWGGGHWGGGYHRGFVHHH
jgi:hypothetical protein